MEADRTSICDQNKSSGSAWRDHASVGFTRTLKCIGKETRSRRVLRIGNSFWLNFLSHNSVTLSVVWMLENLGFSTEPTQSAQAPSQTPGSTFADTARNIPSLLPESNFCENFQELVTFDGTTTKNTSAGNASLHSSPVNGCFWLAINNRPFSQTCRTKPFSQQVYGAVKFYKGWLWRVSERWGRLVNMEVEV